MAGQFAGVFEGYDAHAAARYEIDECCGHFAPVAELEGTLAEPAAGDEADCIGGAAVDFDKGYEALAIGTAGVGDSQALKTEKGHAHAEDLPGAQVAVRCFSFHEKFVERFQRLSAGSLGPLARRLLLC